MVALRKAAITWGPERLRIRLESSPSVTSRKYVMRAILDRPVVAELCREFPGVSPGGGGKAERSKKSPGEKFPGTWVSG